MARHKRSPKADREEILERVARLVRTGKWLTLDTETTGLRLQDQVVEVAICEPVLPELPTRSWLIRPSVPIQEEATHVHGICMADLAEAPTYAECWPQIEAIINGRKNVMYNADFDYWHLSRNARAHGMNPPYLWTGQCAMHWYAVFHGEPFGYDSYRFQSLEAACEQMEIPIEGPLHRAATDARMTAKLILKMAEIAERELPSWRWEFINGREKTGGLGNEAGAKSESGTGV